MDIVDNIIVKPSITKLPIKQIKIKDDDYRDLNAKYWNGYEVLKTINGESLFGKGDININNTLMIKVSYSNLKELRKDSQLIPGQQYRITDYTTTTMQENTISAGHQFDIIVTALDESTLSEEAKAIQKDNDDYFDSCNLSAWKIWYSLDNDVNRFKWANTYEFIYTSNCKPFVGYTSDVNDTFCFDDDIVAIARVLDDSSNGEFYETLDGGLNEVFTHFGYTDDIYGVKQLTLYSIGIDNGEYEYGSIMDTYHYKGIFTIDGEEYDAWARFVGSTYGAKEGYSGSPSENKIIYTLTNRIVSGEIIYEPFGKGVIYRMIDEWGNDCPYDFKNIQFKREIYYDGLGIASTEGDGDFDAYCYTFSWEDSVNVIMDASIFGNNGYLLNEERQINGVYGNIIGVYNNYDYDESPQSTKQYLNDIVFFSTYGYESGNYYGCYSNTFGNDCFNNTFGNDCYSNTFGNYCSANTFGNECYSNTFGNYCSTNTFGNDCYSNTFGNECYSNTFGNGCSSNTFGNGCFSNNFSNGCSSNIFSNYCSTNIFGTNCIYNTFCNYCRNNKFGNSCSSNIFNCNCYSNTFGTKCYSNTFGNDCSTNIFGTNCMYNTFDIYCEYNTFGDYCSFNTFGNYCRNNKFGSASKTKSYYRHIIFDNGNSYIRLHCLATTGTLKYYQNVRIGLGVNNKTTYKTIGDVNVGQTYETLYKPAESQTILI